MCLYLYNFKIFLGTFYTWEMLKVPIIPFVSYGGYDLYPVGNLFPLSVCVCIFINKTIKFTHIHIYYCEGTYVNQTGKIYIRYLKPIMPHEAKSRDEMHNLVSAISINIFSIKSQIYILPVFMMIILYYIYYILS